VSVDCAPGSLCPGETLRSNEVTAGMSYTVTPFEVTSKVLPKPAQVHFVHLMPGISIRHSDTMDSIFRVNGQRVLVAIPTSTLTELRQTENKYLTDQQLVDVAALFLKRRLRDGYDDVVTPGRVAEGNFSWQRTFWEGPDSTQAELLLSDGEVRALARELGYL
jgi:hypothetical protein